MHRRQLWSLLPMMLLAPTVVRAEDRREACAAFDRRERELDERLNHEHSRDAREGIERERREVADRRAHECR